MQPQAVTQLDIAFPGNVTHLMPAFVDIPKEFKRFSTQNKWVDFAEQWFYTGASAQDLIPKPDIDQQMALNHLRVIMGSFQPKHEHKIAAVAWLLSQWFDFAS